MLFFSKVKEQKNSAWFKTREENEKTWRKL